MDEYNRLRLECHEAYTTGNLELANSLIHELYPYMCQMEEARRQIFVNAAKKVILENAPKSFDVKTFAVTVCPESCDTHIILDDIAKKINSVSAVLSNKYVYEQRSKEGEPEKGWHIHCYIQTTYRQSKLKQFVLQKLKNITCILDVRPADERYLTHYMAGDKGTDDKLAKVSRDRQLREAYKIPDIFEYVK